MSRPLAGRTVVVTRAAEQAGGLIKALRDLGADVIELALIETVPPADDGEALRSALDDLAAGDWLAVTSTNGVAAVVDTLAGRPLPAGVQTAAVGPATAAALRQVGIEPALVPAEATAAALAAALGARPGARIVLAQAEGAHPALADTLAAAGWDVHRVTAYRTVPVAPDRELLERAAAADAITFASGSTVDAFVAAAGGGRAVPAVVCIGPVTAAVARRHGLAVAAVADPHTTDGLVAAVTRALGAGGRR
jgi:uroporphyrinogen-III synthase